MIPASIAGAEWSFSSLKRIKSANCSTIGLERLCGFTQIAMESDLVWSLAYSEIIDEFSRKKAQRLNHRKTSFFSSLGRINKSACIVSYAPTLNPQLKQYVQSNLVNRHMYWLCTSH